MPDITITIANATRTHTMTMEQAQLLGERIEAAKPIPKDVNGDPLYTIQEWGIEILVQKLRGLNRRGKKVLAKEADRTEEDLIIGE